MQSFVHERLVHLRLRVFVVRSLREREREIERLFSVSVKCFRNEPKVIFFQSNNVYIVGMAKEATTSNSLAAPTFSFHQATFGQNIRLENDAMKAVRHTSFDHGRHSRSTRTLQPRPFFLGITFSDRPVNINERIHLKIVEVDETRQWCGSLAIGNPFLPSYGYESMCPS